MNRRRFLRNTVTLAGATAVLGTCPRLIGSAARHWRTFDLTTHVELLNREGTAWVWVPLPLIRETPFQRSMSTTVHCPAGRWTSATGAAGLHMIAAEFPAASEPTLTVISRVRVRDWSVDLQRPATAKQLSAAERRTYLEPTRYVPTDGVVRLKALEITKGAETDEEKARAIYDWIVVNTYRKPAVRGCGTGSIRPLLETGDLGGKCADISALYVGLARSAGLPARDVYGIRVAPSRLGYRSLGPATAVVSQAQHCRAEVWLERFGWVPIDPADVRKVILEEPPGHLAMDDPKVQQARERLFGSWEMNWIAFNFAQDVTLPGSKGAALPFLMYPQAESAEGRLDSLDPSAFRYEITAAEI